MWASLPAPDEGIPARQYAAVINRTISGRTMIPNGVIRRDRKLRFKSSSHQLVSWGKRYRN
jgi:hypothetical protein